MPASSFRRSRPVVLGLAGLGLAGALAGCSTAGTTTGGSASGSSSSSDTTASATASSYKDGTYSADGSYQSPSGTETITVTLTLADDKVTAVEIGKHATNPSAIEYQTMFANGISALVVGKDINSLAVSRVAGSSLTSGGFAAALASIEKQAAES